MGKKIKMALPKNDKMEEWIHGNNDEFVSKNSKSVDKQKTVIKLDEPKQIKQNKEDIDLPEIKNQIKRLTIDLPADIHKAFKMKTTINDVTMVDIVKQFVYDYVKN